MRNLVFGYKRWYCKLNLICNLIIPLFILMSTHPENFKWGKLNLSSVINGSFKTAHLIAAIFLLISLVFSCFYSFKTCGVYRNANHGLDKNKEKARYDFLVIGVILNIVNVFIFVLSMSLSFSSFSWLKYFGYVLASISVLLGTASNVFINLFEAKSYSIIFCKRHAETDIKDVVRGAFVPIK